MCDGKHAYLIMAHHRMDVLTQLLLSLDDRRCDIYLHIDKKCKEVLNIELKNSELYFIESMDVRWGDSSQIFCELNLLKEAFNNKEYVYFHLLTGASFPIKDLDFIYNFFLENKGKEFVGYDNQNDYSDRIRYYHINTKIGKPTSKIDYLKLRIHDIFIGVQKRIGFNRLKNRTFAVKKGIAYWSITNDCAKYLLDNEAVIRSIYVHSFCADEIFVQTMVYNSKFKDSIYAYDDEFISSLRFMPWDSSIGDRENHCFLLEDYKYIKESECLYALKFDSDDGLKLIDLIKRELLKKSD